MLSAVTAELSTATAAAGQVHHVQPARVEPQRPADDTALEYPATAPAVEHHSTVSREPGEEHADPRAAARSTLGSVVGAELDHSLFGLRHEIHHCPWPVHRPVLTEMD